MSFRTLRSLNVAGRCVFVRVDFNVPLTPDGAVGDDTRIVASLPTLRYLIEKGARLVVASHLGRPKGKRDPKQSLAPVRERLERYLRKSVGFAESIVGPEAERLAGRLADGDVLLLENLRFDPREEANDPGFSRELGRLADAYVNDAFGAAHRAHASITGITTFLVDCAAGFLLERELQALGKLLEAPGRPYTAILGGAKISGKIDVLRNLLPRVDRLIVGGGMMFTFLRAKGLETGRSLVEEDKVPLAKEILARPEAEQKLILPRDCIVAADASGRDPGHAVGVDGIPPGLAGVDIGPGSIEEIVEALSAARTVFWNGPMGVFEVPAYARGTLRVAKGVAEATGRGAFTVVGGGDSLAAIHQAGVEHQISHCSTGGGASLEFLEGRVLPGVAALEATSEAAP
ncbi:MAG: phosphoglycerate kinase [Candidatus Eisenbacteria bacterium]|uniref:Phosphoglycerate kinase n=1 Tax=Eiseniibacteriota bacterium TaxID=2212470 RepID=A0A538T5Q2_UNCEI|nr:MAG: phosphoglycerate kinase [Candidatus Eisenbacteria bacterium]